MKNTIRISYEDRKNPIYFEISESEYQIMVDADVENRTKNAIANGESENYVAPPRSVQQILDEEINRPTYNINQKETRRHCLLSSVDPNNKYICDNHDFVDDLLAKENIEELYQAIDRLQPQQKELLYQIFWKNKKQKELANKNNVSKAALSQRLKRIYKILKNFLN